MAAPTLPEISATAERLRNVLSTRRPGDYSPSSVLGDVVIDAHAILFADLTAQLRSLQVRQSFSDLRGAPPSPEVTDAVDGLLSNLFVTRAVGTFARGVARLYFTQRVDALLPRNTRFFRAGGLVYYPNIAEARLIQANEMRAVYSDTGAVTGWVVTVNVVAARTGSAYRVGPGRFVSVDPFSPYLAYAETLEDFSAGADADTSDQAIANAETALSLRSLVNARSNSATLRNLFTEITRVRSVGMGDPEMRRDLLAPSLYPGAPIHRGGHVDVYIDLPVQTVTERLVIGEAVRRADNRTLTFADTAADFVGDGVLVGDILSVSAGLPEAPATFRIAAVRATELDIVEDAPFSIASDEAGVPSLTYSVGYNYPAFDNRVASHSSGTAVTTRLLSIAGGAILPGGPVGAITRVEIPDPPSALLPFVDPTTGGALFSVQRNEPWPRAPRAGEPLSFRYAVLNPLEAQSLAAVHYLELGWPGEDLAGTEVLVTYETALGFDVVAEVLTDAETRVLSANYLARGAYLVYVDVAIPYRQRAVSLVDPIAGSAPRAVDEAAVVNALVALVEGAPITGLSASAFSATALRADENIESIYPFPVYYSFTLPDGRVVRYSTNDRLDLLPEASSTATVLNYTELGLTQGDTEGFKRLLRLQGVSTRVARFRTSSARIAMESR